MIYKCLFTLFVLKVRFQVHTVGPRLIYDDKGTGARYDFSCYAPITGSTHQYVIGHFGIGASRNGRKPTPYVMSVIGDKPENIFKRPTHYQQIWKDSGSGGQKEGSFWTVVCPNGFASLSDLCQLGYGTPSSGAVWCINKRYLENDYHDKWIWDDRWSGAYDDVDIMGGRTRLTKELVSATNRRGQKKTLKGIKNTFIE